MRRLTQRARTWFHCHRATIAFVILALAVAGSDAAYVHGNAESTANRRHDNCVSRQSLYDGEIRTVTFIATELHASPAQLARGLHDLQETLGARPSC